MTWPRPPLDKNIILYLYIADASHIQPLLSRSETNNMRRVVVDSLYTRLLLSRIATFLNASLMKAARYIYISLIAIANGIRLPHAEYWKSPPASSTCYAQRPVISILHLWWLDMFDFPSFFLLLREREAVYTTLERIHWKNTNRPRCCCCSNRWLDLLYMLEIASLLLRWWGIRPAKLTLLWISPA